MAGPDYKLKCMLLFGNKGMPSTELKARKEYMEKVSGGRLAVVATTPLDEAVRWCGVGSFGDER
jgi:hypothetical protein